MNNEEQDKKFWEKMQKGNSFDLDDFLNQMQNIRKIGSLSSILGLLPDRGKQMKEMRKAIETPEAEQQLRRTEAMILSMTRQERQNPEVINDDRCRRIAAGSGTSVEDISDLLAQLKSMREMMQS